MTSEELYKQAHCAHYTEHNADTARATYLQLVSEYPGSKEAEYAKSQLEILSSSMSAPASHLTAEPRASKNGSHPSAANKSTSWFAALWQSISWQRKAIGGLALLGFIFGLATPEIPITLAVLIGVAAYFLRKKNHKRAILLAWIALPFAATGGLGLLIQNHFDEQRAQEQRQAERAATKEHRQAEKVAMREQQAQKNAEDAKNKAARIQALDKAVSRSEGWIASKTGTLRSFHLEDAQGAMDAIATELAKDISLATEQNRTDIAATLQKLVGESQDAFAESRKVVFSGQIANAERSYAAGNLMEASKHYRNAIAELKGTNDYANSPSSFKEWARLELPVVQAQLDKAIRVSELPDAVQYFKEWAGKKRKIKTDIRDLGSQDAHRQVIVELTRAELHLQALDKSPSDENHLVPSKYRSKSFIRARRKELKKFEKNAKVELEYVLTCGDKPNHWLVDGGNPEAKHLMKQSAHDPDSIEIENCSPPELTMRQCWKYQCSVRGRNAFGAKVLNRKTFHQSAASIEVR